jgi:tetratricopeptide (TPR) repeat protein
MKEMGFFSPNDWNVLSRQAPTWMKEYDIANRYPDLSQEESIEEAIAEAFASYQQQEPNVASIFQKALDTLQKLGNFISGLGFRSTSDIFGEASSGALAKSRAEVIDAFDKFLDTNVDKEPKYQVAAARTVMNGIDGVIRNSSIGSDTQKAAISNGIQRAGEIAKSSLLAMLPMHALGEIADSVFPGLGSRFNSLINERSGYQDKLNNGIDPAMKELKDAIRVRPEQRGSFDNVVNNSTIAEVDPTKPRSYYKDKKLNMNCG